MIFFVAVLLAADAVSPMTAAGVEKPAGLDWGAKGNDPAGSLFKNVQVLKDVTGDRFMAGMQSMRANLGVKCTACHDVAGKDFASDKKKNKERARRMIRMTAEINQRTFNAQPVVTCWACHRGKEEPPKMKAFGTMLPGPFRKLSAADLKKPAEQVFKDVKALKGVDGKNFGLIMGWFARELGVKCTYCHKEGDFAAATDKKDRARQMLAMTGYVADDFYKGNSPIGCGTCHRGEPIPLTWPGHHAK
jgi:hypothetical protein